METFLNASKRGEPPIECPYSNVVKCYSSCKNCEKCGWNPEVAERRLKEFLNYENESET